MARQQPSVVSVEPARRGCGCGGCLTVIAVAIVIALAIEYWYLAAIVVGVIGLVAALNFWQRRQEPQPPQVQTCGGCGSTLKGPFCGTCGLPHAARCRGCGAPLDSPYCAHCGRPAAS